MGPIFPYGNTKIEDTLIWKDQHLPIEGVTKKPPIMTDEAWKLLHKKTT